MRKKCILIMNIIIFLICLSGCWNRRELNTLAVSIGIAVDLTEEREPYKLTSQIVLPSRTEKESNSTKKPYYNLMSEGKTLFDALRNATHESGRKVYLPHTKVLLIGEEAAKRGIVKYLDLFSRDHETRPNLKIIVVKGKASEVLEIESKIEKVPAFSLDKLTEMQKATSQSTVVNLLEFNNNLISKTTEPTCGVIEVNKKNGNKVVEMYGTAVFKGEKLVDYLDDVETRGFLWIKSDVKSGIIVIPSTEENEKISVEIIKEKTKIKTEIKENNIEFTIRIEGDYNVGEFVSDKKINNSETLELIREGVEKVIILEIKSALNKAKDLNTDIFGFGEKVHKKYPKEWSSIEEQWNMLFQDIKVKYEFQTNIHGAGTVSNTAIPRN